MNLKQVAEEALELVKKAGIEKAQVSVGSGEIQELELTGDEVNLCRTNNDFGVRIKGIQEGRQAIVSTNRWSEESKTKLMKELEEGIEASEVDEAFDILKSKEKKSFKGPQIEPEMPKALEALNAFVEQVKEEHPQVALRMLPFKFNKSSSLLMNTHGMELSQEESYYDYFVMFSGREGEKTSSFNYTSNITRKIPENFLDHVGLRDLFGFSEKLVNAIPYNQEVKGELVLSPYVLSSSFLGFLLGQISSTSLVGNSSLLLGKKGEKVLSEKFSLQSLPFDERFGVEAPFSGEGVLYKDSFIFEKGHLSQYLLDVFGSKKLGEPLAASPSRNLRITPGSTSKSDLIGGVKKGLLLMGFSGGSPSVNGDFSGVAKNSFLIEDGKVTKPLKEVMISGNIFDLFSQIEELSSDIINNGTWEFPWIKTRL